MFLLAEEAEYALQNKLAQFMGALNNLVSQPQDANHQNNVSSTLTQVDTAFSSFEAAITPAQQRTLEEIGATPFFGTTVSAQIKKLMAENALTPAVVQGRVKQLIDKRGSFISALTSANQSLAALLVTPDEPEEGFAEIGFLIPRGLFDNRLDGLVRELRDIELIVRHFSEVVVGGIEDVTVNQISTTDPIFFFGLHATTIAAIGGSITWMLNTWKQALEIKKKYNELKDLGIDDDVLGKIEENVTKKVEKSIEARTQELIEQYDGDGGRKNELKAGLKWAMRALMARVERGLLVEIRALPPKKPAEGEADEVQEAYERQTGLSQEVERISKDLDFPAIEGEPILKIPPPKSKDVAAESKSESRKEKKS